MARALGPATTSRAIVVTPADGSDVPAACTVVVRPAEPPPAPLSKYAGYTIEDGVFRGYLAPDGGLTNFDARAAKADGVPAGPGCR